MKRRLQGYWIRLWMRWAGTGPVGRWATRLAGWGLPPYYGRRRLSRVHPKGYVAPTARIAHPGLRRDANVFLDDGVLIYRDDDGGPVALGERVQLYRDTVIQTGHGGSVTVGELTAIQPRCQLSGYVSEIRIGARVDIAPNCGFYPYDHGVAPGRPIRGQALTSKGPIVIEDDAWLGFGVVVLSGVTIGTGAVVGAGSVVTRDVPPGAIAAGSPARILKRREELPGGGEAAAGGGEPEA